MSVYKIVIGKDMAPQKENTSQLNKLLPGEFVRQLMKALN